MNRTSFLFYRSFYDAVRDLPNEQFAIALKGILAYTFEGIEYNGSDHIARVVYMLIKPIIDANNQRWVNGKKGGRPKKQNETNKVSNSNQSETSLEPIDNQDETDIEGESNQNLITYNPPNNLDISELIPTENQNETKTKPNFENSKPNIGYIIKEEGIGNGEGYKEKKSLSQKKERARERNFENFSLTQKKASNENFLSENFEKNDVVTGKERARERNFEDLSLSKKASNENFLSENFEKNDVVIEKERARERNFEDLSLSKKASNENFLSENFKKNDVVTGKERARERIFEELPQIQKNADNEDFSNEKLQKNDVVTGKESERERESAKNWGAAANFNAKSTDNEDITPKKQSIDDVQKEFEATSHYETLVMQRGINKQQARDALRIFVSDCKLRGDMMMDMREFRVRFSKLLPYLVKEIKANNNNSTNNIAKGW